VKSEQNCVLSFLLSAVPARAVLFLFNVFEPNVLRESLTLEFSHSLALQLHFPFEVSAACVGLVSSPPERPCENTVDRDAPLSELDGDAADFLD